jgi:hypothetical protein
LSDHAALEDKGFNENKLTIARELLVPGVTLEKMRAMSGVFILYSHFGSCLKKKEGGKTARHYQCRLVWEEDDDD